MGYCGIKIPGHTGTDFKHKKAFTKPKEFLSYKRKMVDIKLEPRETNQSHFLFIYFKRIISILSILTLLLLVYFFSSRIGNIALHRTHLSSEYLKSIEKSENKRAAEMMYSSAKLYYDSGGFDFAQDEITRVLKLYPTNSDALQLLSKILSKQCEINNKYCKEAKEYQEYLTMI